MSVDIRLAWSLEQILRSQLMKRPFDVFDAKGEPTLSKSPITAAKKVPQQSQWDGTAAHTSLCVQNTQTHCLAALQQILWVWFNGVLSADRSKCGLPQVLSCHPCSKQTNRAASLHHHCLSEGLCNYRVPALLIKQIRSIQPEAPLLHNTRGCGFPGVAVKCSR